MDTGDRARQAGVRTLDELSETASAQEGWPAPRNKTLTK